MLRLEVLEAQTLEVRSQTSGLDLAKELHRKVSRTATELYKSVNRHSPYKSPKMIYCGKTTLALLGVGTLGLPGLSGVPPPEFSLSFISPGKARLPNTDCSAPETVSDQDSVSF